jgi:Protein of unknown function (DUF5818)
MRQILLASVLLLGASWMAAQTSSGTGQANQSGAAGSGQSTTGQSSGNMGNNGQTSNTAAQKTVTGCLSESNGQYTLTTKHGHSYELMGESSELANHVGHEIRVTGTETSGSAAAANGAGSAASGNDNGMAQSASSAHTIQVTSFKHISKTCTNAGGNMGGSGM